MCVQGEHHVKMRSEIRMINLQTKEHQRVLADHQKLGKRPGIDPSLVPSEGGWPLDLRLLAFRSGSINFCCLSHSFVILCYGSHSKIIQL